jgi:hypothetical protein
MSVADKVDTQYPHVYISVRSAGVLPISLTVQASEDSEPLVNVFASVEQAEYAVDKILTNMRLADEANKRIKEKLHGSRTD